MEPRYVLIDFENLQPKSLGQLADPSFKFLVFLGATQNRIPLEMAKELQRLGAAAEYVQAAGTGKNALDFMIAFKVGQLSKSSPKASFYIVSKDGGFGPLVAHAAASGLKVFHAKDIADIPLLQLQKPKTTDDMIQAIAQNLKGRGQARPRKVKTLQNTINALHGNNLTEAELAELVKRLKDQGHISVDGTNVSYNL